MARSLTSQDVALVADRVGGVGEQGAVGADRDAADGVEVVVARPGRRGRAAPPRRAARARRGRRPRPGPAGSSRPGRRPAPGTTRRTRGPRRSGRSTTSRGCASAPRGRSPWCGALISSKICSRRSARWAVRAAVQAFSASRYAVTSGSSLARSQSYSSVRLRPWCSVVTGRRSATGGRSGVGVGAREPRPGSSSWSVDPNRWAASRPAPTSIASCSSSATSSRPGLATARPRWSTRMAARCGAAARFLDPDGGAAAGRGRCSSDARRPVRPARRGRRRRRRGWAAAGCSRGRGARWSTTSASTTRPGGRAGAAAASTARARPGARMLGVPRAPGRPEPRRCSAPSRASCRAPRTWRCPSTARSPTRAGSSCGR